MTLFERFLDILTGWKDVFPQDRSTLRAVRQALGSLLCIGRRTLTRIIWTNGGQNRSWSAEYHLHSRSPWKAQELFSPVLKGGLAYCPGRLVGVAVDDTRLRKTGRCIESAFYQRDPLSPHFHCNLMLGLRFLQASLLVPSHRRAPVSTRALPIRFQEVPTVKRPARRASDEEWKKYRAAAREHNLSTRFVEMIKELRSALDLAGALKKVLVIAGDGSFCNRTVFRALLDRTELIMRARKDAVLCSRAPAGSRRFYDTQKFTPEQVRQDDSILWQVAKLFYGGKRRKIRFKEVTNLYWQGGARQRPLRLLVIAPTPYKKRKSSRTYYRNPAYLLTTSLQGDTAHLLQIYFDRWQIEVNHREEKDTLGVGQAQLWNEKSVPRQPAFVVASYSALLLASLQAFGPTRGDAYAPLPKWRRKAHRPSCLDLVTLLRKEAVEHPELLTRFNLFPSHEDMVKAAAA